MHFICNIQRESSGIELFIQIDLFSTRIYCNVINYIYICFALSWNNKLHLVKIILKINSCLHYTNDARQITFSNFIYESKLYFGAIERVQVYKIIALSPHESIIVVTCTPSFCCELSDLKSMVVRTFDVWRPWRYWRANRKWSMV